MRTSLIYDVCDFCPQATSKHIKSRTQHHGATLAQRQQLKSGQCERGYGGWSRPSRTFGADACSQCRGGTPAVFGTRVGCCRLQPRPSWSWIAQMTGSLWCNLSPRSGASRSRRQLFPLSLASWRHPCRTATFAQCECSGAQRARFARSRVHRTSDRFFQENSTGFDLGFCWRLGLSWGDSSIP
jgi:hypothetical protein